MLLKKKKKKKKKIKNDKLTSDELIQSLNALRGVVKRAADSPSPFLVVLLLS